jgi:hypothetical protein
VRFAVPLRGVENRKDALTWRGASSMPRASRLQRHELVVEASMVGAPCPDGAEGVDALLISPRAMP